MAAQKPTIGRIVHAFRYKDGQAKGPYAAIVTHVHSATVVNLTVFGSNAGAEALEVTSAGEDDGQVVAGWAWAWPPKV